ncbi:hypothetical protein [Photobacterium sp. TY1-4]|uniref:hypothetical protein n=1 Tax=Photobacterium sp. TY1-4 TaxID=2899122 RepID=UPI0021C1D148|nr:hypothetical protein [Photobacterium sp. TY1-4]UXI04727.1 hypothetical protein NH461_25585 [Photobacterium sp. TY1-4]
MTLLFVYLSISAIASAWLGWVMYARLDQFDWAFNKSEIWFTWGTSAVFWPLSLRRKYLRCPEDIFRGDSTKDQLAEEHRNLNVIRERIYRGEIPCGETVSYRQRGTYATFTTRPQHLAAKLREMGAEESEYANDHAFLHWLDSADPDLPGVFPAPLKSRYAKAALTDLHTANHAQVWCWECWQDVPGHGAEKITDGARPGSTYRRYICGNGHLLLSQFFAHYFFGRKS